MCFVVCALWEIVCVGVAPPTYEPPPHGSGKATKRQSDKAAGGGRSARRQRTKLLGDERPPEAAGEVGVQPDLAVEGGL